MLLIETPLLLGFRDRFPLAPLLYVFCILASREHCNSLADRRVGPKPRRLGVPSWFSNSRAAARRPSPLSLAGYGRSPRRDPTNGGRGVCDGRTGPCPQEGPDPATVDYADRPPSPQGDRFCRAREADVTGFDQNIEDEAVARADQPTLVSAFRRHRFRSCSRSRWTELGRMTILFPLPERSGGRASKLVTLAESDPMAPEWSVICDSSSFKETGLGVEK
jgi:hypothetical protein